MKKIAIAVSLVCLLGLSFALTQCSAKKAHRASTVTQTTPAKADQDGVVDESPLKTRATQSCSDDYDPVCGDNNVTYLNACDAEKYGHHVAYPNSCQQSRICSATEKPVCVEVVETLSTGTAKKTQYIDAINPCQADQRIRTLQLAGGSSTTYTISNMAIGNCKSGKIDIRNLDPNEKFPTNACIRHCQKSGSSTSIATFRKCWDACPKHPSLCQTPEG